MKQDKRALVDKLKKEKSCHVKKKQRVRRARGLGYGNPSVILI